MFAPNPAGARVARSSGSPQLTSIPIKAIARRALERLAASPTGIKTALAPTRSSSWVEGVRRIEPTAFAGGQGSVQINRRGGVTRMAAKKKAAKKKVAKKK
jgi:hypothetical protein